MLDGLKTYIKNSSPFGPIDAGVIEIGHKAVLKDLFDPQNKIYNALKSNPSIIIGRRGSGKTAYLHSVFIGHEFGIVQEVKTSKTFSQIVDAIEKSVPTAFLSESVAELWEQLFYFALFSEVAKKYRTKKKEFRLLSDYLAKENLGGATSIDVFLWKLINVLREKSGSHLVGAVAEIVSSVTGTGFEEVKTLVIDVLTEKNERAILLLDSLEQYPTSFESVARAISGLLKCVGQFNERNDRLNIRLCLPAELYHVFLDVSSNPLKDLSNSVTLHWVAGELLSIAAQRLSLYLRLYYQKEYEKSLTYNLDLRDHVQEFLRYYLPAQVTNRLGTTEDVIAYILRHTQLQPRHLLMYLNSIFEKQQKLDLTEYPKISETAVKNGIASIEHRLCQEVFSGYQSIHPTAKAVCEACIPELSLCFTHSEAQKVFTRHGKKSSGARDYWEFRRLLIETGIVGRVVGETDRYIIGRFEYTEPHKLVVSTEDLLCLHPVFAEVYNFRSKGVTKTIYPYGCDPNAEDHRSWQFE